MRDRPERHEIMSSGRIGIAVPWYHADVVDAYIADLRSQLTTALVEVARMTKERNVLKAENARLSEVETHYREMERIGL